MTLFQKHINMNFNKLIVLLSCVLTNITIYSQSPSWPLDNNWNQINCTFAEKHSEFHGGIDINLVNGNDFKAILDGIVENDASSSAFLIPDMILPFQIILIVI